MASQGITLQKAFFPERAPIDAYGNGGFRFAGHSHIGGILALPSGIYGWQADKVDALTAGHFSRIVEEASNIDLLLIGTGEGGTFPSKEILQFLRNKKVRPEMMSTGAAVRTYNVLLAENRSVAAAFLPVERV